MTPLKAFVIVVAWIGVFATGGLAVGAALGALAPDYYPALFRLDEDANVISFGMAIGLAQGAVFGLAGGLLTVIVVTWYRLRTDDRH